MAGNCMKSTEHILFFTPGFPQDEQDVGCLPSLQNYILSLHEKGYYALTVLSLHYPFRESEYHWHGIRVIALGGANRKFPARFSLWRKALKRLREIHRQEPVDLVHSFWMHECGMLGNYFTKKHHLPHILTLMGQDLRSDNNYVKWIDQQYPQLVQLSSFRPGNTKVRLADLTIPFGIRKEEKKYVKPGLRDIDVLGIGSFIPLKNYARFISLMEKLKTIHPTIKVVIIGEGVGRDILERQIEKSGLTENIELTGYLPRFEVYDYLNRAKVFLHTSEYESQGYVFNEALLAGVPIVSTPVGIAKTTLFWRVSDRNEELLENLQYFLKHKIEIPASANIWMEKTVENYTDLYERSLRSKATKAASKK